MVLIMETPKNIDTAPPSSTERESKKFNRSEFTIFMDKVGNNVDVFYVKSEEMFQKISHVINKWINFIASKFKGVFKKKSIEVQQIKLSKKLYEQQQELEKSLKKIEATMEKTSELTEQIKEDTSNIVLKIDQVVFILDHQMETLGKVDQIEEYMIKNLGSDWTQIKNFWAMYKRDEITRSDFIKKALKKTGKKFLGIFVNTVS